MTLNTVLARLEKLHPKMIDLSLGRIEALLAKLGNPHLQLPPVVHVAGTNGKGSTLAFLRAMLEAAGYRVHVYTSPHLIEFNERIRLAGELVADDVLIAALQEIEHVNAGAPVTFFEITTAAAFLLFSRTQADIVLLETGLGGRLDATNVIRKPAVTAITRISIDHTEFLGDTIEKIAAEKAGIMKMGVPCIVAPQYDQEVVLKLQKYAKKTGALLLEYGKDWQLGYPKNIKEYAPVFSAMASGSDDEFRLSNGNVEQTYSIPAYLIGAHQIINAGVALMILAQLKNFNVSAIHRSSGIQKAEWQGRLEYLGVGTVSERLPNGTQLWFDGAHNDSGAEVLAQQLYIWKKETPNIKNILVVGMLKHKNADTFFKHLMPACDELYILDQLENKFFKPDALSAHIKIDREKLQGTSLLTYNHLSQMAALYPDNRIIICGSLYLRELL